MGPIEYIEFAFDDHDVCDNYAWVVFKHACSVEDSIRLFRGTKLYGLPITTKQYSEDLEHPVFDDQLNYFKQLVDVERNSHSNDCSKSRWNDQSSDNIPDCLPEPPMHNNNSYQDNYDHKSHLVSRHGYKDRSCRYQHDSITHAESGNPTYKSDYKSHHNHDHYQKPNHNRDFGTMEVPNNERDLYHNNRNYKHQDYNSHMSSNWKESSYRNEELSLINKNDFVKELPVRDLRDTMYRKRSVVNSDYNNTAYTSQLDLRDTLYHNKSNKYEDLKQPYESNSKIQWSERNHKSNGRGSNSFPDYQSRKPNYSSERYNESNTRHQNHYAADREYYEHDQSYNKDSLQKYNEYPNNYNREKNRSNTYKFNEAVRPQNMESSGRPHSSYHSYKRSDQGYERKDYKNLHNEWSGGYNHNRNYSKNSDRSRQNYYS